MEEKLARFDKVTSDFITTFSKEYAIVRPSYPREMFEWLASVAPPTRLCWDCGAGSGQIAVGLAQDFDRVYATDGNKEMLVNAKQHENVEYHCSYAEDKTELEDNSVDLITAGMAAHWFDLDRFYAEASRVLRPSGVLALICFFFFEVEPEIDQQVKDWYFGSFKNDIPPEMLPLHEGYRDLYFPFERMPSPKLYLRMEWTLEEMANFIGQWVVVKKTVAAGQDPLADLIPDIRIRWGNERREVRWPLSVLACRKPVGN